VDCSRAARQARIDHQHVYLLGLVPEEIDPELGYILPDDRAAMAASSRAPIHREALDRICSGPGARRRSGGSVHRAASARALLVSIPPLPGLVADMSRAVDRDGGDSLAATAARALYPQLPTLDFSRDVVQGQESRLRVLTVPACGWSDLGTPRRVAETLSRIAKKSNPRKTLVTPAY